MALDSTSREGENAALYSYVIYQCVLGSRAYGLDVPGSDWDRRGFYLPPAERQWALDKVPEQLENPATEEVYWEIEKFLALALKANPGVLECLYSPLVEKVTPLAQELLDMREIFLSRLIYQTFNGYAVSQFRKLEQDQRTRGEIRWKHAMHLVRLLLAAITALKEGYLPVEVGDHRAGLLAIRRGEMTWPEIDRWRQDLHRQLETAYFTTRLPDQPDYNRANAFLIKARRAAL